MSEHKQQVRRRPARWRDRVGLVLVVLFVAAACTNEPAAESTSLPDTTTSTSEAPTTSSTTTVPEPTTTAVNPEAPILEAWDAFWDAFADLRASDALDTSVLDGVASPALTSFLRDAVRAADRIHVHAPDEEPRGPVESDTWTWARVTSGSGTNAVLEACTIFSEPWLIDFEKEPTDWLMAGMHHVATLEQSDPGWVVTELDYQGSCVPAELAQPAIDAYIEGRQALRETIWNPPDPDHPLLGQFFAEPRLSNLVDLLREHQEQGLTVRGIHELHPVVLEVHSPTELIVLDCYEVASDYGLYDLDTGERRPDPPMPTEGQTGIASAHMLLVDGTWKNSLEGGQIEWSCTFGEQALPQY